MDYGDLMECPYCGAHFTELMTKLRVLYCPLCLRTIPEEEKDE